MDIGEILTKAWQIIWKHKVLWIFGLLASCANAGSNGSNGLRYEFDSSDNIPGIVPPEGLENFFNNLEGPRLFLFIGGLLLIGLLVILVLVFLSTIGRIGLIRGAYLADQGAEKLTFGELFTGSLRYFWRLFGLNLLVWVASFLVALILIFLLVVPIAVTAGLAALCLLPFLCVLVPLAIVVSFFVYSTVEQANVALVVDDIGILEALQRAWVLVRTNLGNILVIYLVVWLGGLVVAFLIALPFFLIVVPAIFGIAAGEQLLGVGIAISLICGVIYLPVLLVLNSMLMSYVETAWTLTYLRLTRRPAAPAGGIPYAPEPLSATPEPPAAPAADEPLPSALDGDPAA